MRLQKRQQLYGFIYGSLAFLLGWAVIYYLTPESVLPEFTRLKATLWVFLSAHSISISGFSLTDSATTSGAVVVSRTTTPVHVFRLFPFIFAGIAALLLSSTVSYTSRFEYVLKNCLHIAIGYVPTALAAFILSDVQPAMTIFIVVGVVVFAAILVGSSIIQGLTGGIPFIGVTSFGAIIAVGLFAIIGGLAVLISIWPLIAIPLTGGLIATALSWTARNVPS